MAKQTISIQSTDNSDIFLNVRDRNSFGGKLVVENKRMVSGETIEVECEIDGNGEAYLDWSAQRADDPTTSHSASERVDAGQTLRVWAK